MRFAAALLYSSYTWIPVANNAFYIQWERESRGGHHEYRISPHLLQRFTRVRQNSDLEKRKRKCQTTPSAAKLLTNRELTNLNHTHDTFRTDATSGGFLIAVHEKLIDTIHNQRSPRSLLLLLLGMQVE